MVTMIHNSPANGVLFRCKNLEPVVIIGVVLFNCFNRKRAVHMSE
jgi:hypothetical protein